MTQVLLFASLREIAGSQTVNACGETVNELLDDLTRQFGEPFEKLLPYCMVLQNNRQVERAATLNDDGEIAILPPVSGG